MNAKNVTSLTLGDILKGTSNNGLIKLPAQQVDELFGDGKLEAFDGLNHMTDRLGHPWNTNEVFDWLLHRSNPISEEMLGAVRRGLQGIDVIFEGHDTTQVVQICNGIAAGQRQLSGYAGLILKFAEKYQVPARCAAKHLY